MGLHDLAPELIYQVYNNLFTISDVINLSLTCHRLHDLLRSTHILSTLFAVADREYGPIEDILMIATHNHSQPAHLQRRPPISYGLLRQVITIGKVGKRFVQLYPAERWHTNFINRRALTEHESHCVRQALYRYWLYCEAYHNRFNPRIHRLLRDVVEERSKLLRDWSNQDLIEIEDVRRVLEDILTYRICPTDGVVQARTNHLDSKHWQTPFHTRPQPQPWSRSFSIRHLFHTSHDDSKADPHISVSHSRLTRMEGWGDDISQYHTVQCLLKLNPARIVHLHDHAVYKWQVEALISQELGDDWFWNNGQTFSDTWNIVLRSRGVDVEGVRDEIEAGVLGAAVDWVDDEKVAVVV